ncbi:hypothetical protein HMPREF9073_01498 [Capnocytophaga sp. oral taxon 326 str. F0382]|nr:hypothetical protein HMPREF9073_01498 [Capnocytophaga sp. oral taxon 326 str. F0382]
MASDSKIKKRVTITATRLRIYNIIAISKLFYYLKPKTVPKQFSNLLIC